MWSATIVKSDTLSLIGCKLESGCRHKIEFFIYCGEIKGVRNMITETELEAVWQECRNEAAFDHEESGLRFVSTRRACEFFYQRMPEAEFAIIFRANDQVRAGFNHWMCPAFRVEREMEERNFGDLIWCEVGRYHTIRNKQSDFMRNAGCGGHD
jgi:hypothetical protein